MATEQTYKMHVVEDWPSGKQYTLNVDCWSKEIAEELRDLTLQSLERMDRSKACPHVRVYLLEDGKVIDYAKYEFFPAEEEAVDGIRA